MAGGRPSKYKKKYCKELVDHMSKGFSFEAFAGRIGTCKQTIYTWTEKHPEFLDAKKIAFESSRFFWEDKGLDYLVEKRMTTQNDKGFTVETSEKLNNTVWIFNMKNRFGWKDRPEEVKDNQIGITIAPDDADL